MYRTFFIGDVHGCYDELKALCDKIRLHAEDHLYFVGDLINKGPKSLEVVEFIRNRPNTWSVIGNHEYYYMKNDDDALLATERTPEDLRKEAKLDENVNSKYRTLRNELSPYREWMLGLPTFIEKEEFILVHGGIHPDYGVSTPTEIATLIRTVHGKPWYESYRGSKKVFYGHWAKNGMIIYGNTIGLDTGCCFGGHLTAYCLESGDITQIRANAVYEQPAHWSSIVKLL